MVGREERRGQVAVFRRVDTATCERRRSVRLAYSFRGIWKEETNERSSIILRARVRVSNRGGVALVERRRDV